MPNPTFQIPFPVEILNPQPVTTRLGDPANNFAFWNSLADCKIGVPSSIRYKGLTVNILEAGKVIEYWWQVGILDNDLVPKNDLSSKQDKLNALISGGVITLGDKDLENDLNDIQVTPATWYINPTTYNTTVDTYFYDIPLCGAGLLRYIEIVANTAGQIIKKEGLESTSPSRPAIDSLTEVSIGWLLISDVVIETVNPVITGFIPLTGSNEISGALTNSGSTSESSVDLANNNYVKVRSTDFTEGESSIYLEGNSGQIVIGATDTAITDISRSISIKKNDVFNISGDIVKYTDALDTSTNTVMTKEVIEGKIDAEPFALITRQYADDHYISSSSGGGSQSIELTVTSFQALTSYTPSTTYKITGVDVNLYGGSTIYLTTNNEGVISTKGIGRFENPKYPKIIGNGIWNNISTYDIPVVTSGVFQNFEDITTNIPTITGKLVSTIYSTHFIALTGDWTDIGITEINGISSGAYANIDVSSIVLNTYSIGDKVIWGGKVWSNLTGNIGTSIDKYTLDSTNWIELSFNPNYYEVVFDEIEYDIKNDIIISRSEKDNIVETSNYFIDSESVSTIKDFQFGNILDNIDLIGNSNIRIVNSYFDNLNNTLDYIKNVECLHISKIYNISSYSTSFIKNLKLTNSSIYNIVLDGSDLTEINMNNSEFRDNIYFDAYNRNLTMNNGLIHTENVIVSFISNIHTIDSTISSSKIIDSDLSYINLKNESSINSIVVTNSGMTNIELSSSNISILSLTNVSNFKDVIINDGSLTNLVSNSFNFENVLITNRIVDRTATPLTANEVGKEYKGNLPTSTTVDTFYIKKNNEVKEISLSDLQVLVGEPTFDENITVSLSDGKTFGRFVNGEPIPSMGKTAREVIKMSVTQTLYPTVTSPSITGFTFNGFIGATAVSANSTQEIGSTISDITVSGSANRGTFTPVYAPVAVTTIQNSIVYTVSGTGSIMYNSVTYNSGQNFTGTGITTFSVTSGTPIVKPFYDGNNNRAGVYNNFAFSGGKISIPTSPVIGITGQSFVVTANANTISVIGSYNIGTLIFESAGGIVPNNYYGANTNPLPAGNAPSVSASLTGAYRRFSKVSGVSIDPTTSTEIRAGSSTFSSVYSVASGNPFTIPAGQLKAWFAYESTRPDVTSITYDQGFGSSALSQFVKTLVDVTLPNGTIIQYKVYTITYPSVQALSTYTITIP